MCPVSVWRSLRLSISQSLRFWSPPAANRRVESAVKQHSRTDSCMPCSARTFSQVTLGTAAEHAGCCSEPSGLQVQTAEWHWLQCRVAAAPGQVHTGVRLHDVHVRRWMNPSRLIYSFGTELSQTPNFALLRPGQPLVDTQGYAGMSLLTCRVEVGVAVAMSQMRTTLLAPPLAICVPLLHGERNQEI